ncbi:MAG TPA: tetratricopeptide repeat protein [Flavobacteriales bacterium]|nr:tetratricopeptide repeat protein [Flavobacteriales bacterium]
MKEYKNCAAFCLLFALYLTSFSAFSQQSNNRVIDSLKKITESKVHDSIRINALVKWDDMIYLSDADMDLQLNNKIERISSANLKQKLAKKELLFFRKALASSCNNQGVVYVDKSDYGKGIKYYYKALNLYEKLNDKANIGKCYNNIGIILQDQKDFVKASEFLKKGLAMRIETADSAGIANSYANIGSNYRLTKKFDTALIYYTKSYALRKRLGNPLQLGYATSFLAGAYSDQGNFEKALELLYEVLRIMETQGEEAAVASAHVNIGNILMRQKKYDEAIVHARKTIALAMKHNEIIYLKDASFVLYKSYQKKGDFEQALSAYTDFVAYRDSISSLQNQRQVIQQQYQHAFEKRTLADSIENAKKDQIKNAEIARQKSDLRATRIQQYMLFGGLGLALIFGIVMFNRFKTTSRQKKEIERQKHLVEEKQKEILDSIHYAKRIQQALLPSVKQVEKYLRKKN